MPSIFDNTVELRHLRYFRAVAEAGSFTRAAAAVGIRQPTLSHQIQQLEGALGETLFQRGRGTCRLTPAGELLLPYAQRVVGEMEALRHSLDDLSGLRRGSLTLATLPVLAEHVLPRALAMFRRAHAGLRVRVLEMSVDDMARALASGTADICIGNLEVRGAKLTGSALFDEELVAVVAPSHKLDARGCISVKELAREPVIAPPAGFGTRTLILHAWAKERRTAVFALETNSTEVVLRTVAGGGGIGIVPASALCGRKPDGWMVARIARPTLRRQIGFWQAHIGRRPPAAEAMLALVREAVRVTLAQSCCPAGTMSISTP